jgi:hypothetical protein
MEYSTIKEKKKKKTVDDKILYLGKNREKKSINGKKKIFL